MKKITLLLPVFALALPLFASAAKGPAWKSMTRSELQTHHEQMAQVHQEVADCLKTGKSEDECREPLREHRMEMMEGMKERRKTRAGTVEKKTETKTEQSIETVPQTVPGANP